MKVHVKNVKHEYTGFFTLEKARLQFEKYDGSTSPEIERENFYRGDSAAALVYDSKSELVLMTRQFRYPVYAVDPRGAWILEVVAGSCKDEEQPKQTLQRELIEEINLKVKQKDLTLMAKFFVSPGGTSERIFLYSLETDLSAVAEEYGGLEEEQEDIQIVLLPFQEVLYKLEKNKINDAKTIVALQWLKSRFPNAA